MKKQTIGKYPRLCLCLIISFLLSGCAESKFMNFGEKVTQTQASESSWTIDILFLPYEGNFKAPATYALQTYPVSSLFGLGQPKLMRLVYLFHSKLEVSLIKEKLYTNGQILKINVSESPN